MSYRSRNSGISSLIGGLFLIYWIGLIIYESSGWSGVCITLGSIFFILFVSYQFIKWRDNQREKKLNKEPCSHGVEGAIRDSSRCVHCTTEKLEAEHIAKVQAAIDEKRKNEERARAYAEWVKQIRLPQYLKTMDPKEFEQLICRLYAKLGYQVQSTRYTGDNGIDGFLRKNGNLTILQCKRVKGSVGQPILRDLYGTMRAENASSGLVVTTGKVSKQAREWIKGKPINIIGLDQLQRLFRNTFSESDIIPETYSTDVANYYVCPQCGHKLRSVNGRHGKFLGCSAYPKCRYTQNI